jgi:protein-tyrosine phosphatase
MIPSSSSSIPAKHNFGPVSSRDDILYTAERPGNPPTKTDLVSDESVQEWIMDMKAHGITHVIALLDDNELSNYSDLPKLYQQAGLQYMQQPMSDPNAAINIYQWIDSVQMSNNGKVVVHCTGGIGRAGRVAAGWLCHKYNLSPDEATTETLNVAKINGVNRKGDVEALTTWFVRK